jgi:hypothetical protein
MLRFLHTKKSNNQHWVFRDDYLKTQIVGFSNKLAK